MSGKDPWQTAWTVLLWKPGLWNRQTGVSGRQRRLVLRHHWKEAG